MKRRTSTLARTFAMMTLAAALTACGSEDPYQASLSGTPNEWWSDNYMAMLQDAEETSGVEVASKKPTRLRLY
jgi:hypothetical protein